VMHQLGVQVLLIGPDLVLLGRLAPAEDAAPPESGAG